MSFSLQEKAKKEKAPLSYAHETVQVDASRHLKTGRKKLIWNEVGLAGPFAETNLKTAVAGMCTLEENGMKVSWKKVNDFLPELLKSWRYIGRCQWIDRQPMTLVDSAHNEAGLKFMMEWLSTLEYHRIHFVLGMVKEKDLSSILPYFPQDGSYYYAKAAIPRGMPADQLREKACKHGLEGKAYTSVRRAYAAARKKCKSGEMIYIGGSIFTVAEVL